MAKRASSPSAFAGANKDYSGRRLDPYMMHRMYKIQKMVSRVDKKGEHASKTLRFLERLGVPSEHLEGVMRIRDGAVRSGITQGYRGDAMLAACVMAYLKEVGIGRPMRSIAACAHVKRGDLYSAYRELDRVLYQDRGRSLYPSGPAPHVNAIMSRMDQSKFTGADFEIIRRKAIEKVSNYMKGYESGGKSPVTLSMAAIFLSAQEMGYRGILTRKYVCDAAGSSTVSMRAGIGYLTGA